MNTLTEKLLPHDIDAEEATIGSIIIGGDVRTVPLIGSDFYNERNRFIFEACKRLVDRGVSINQITIANELGDKLVDVGGAAYLSYLISICPTHLDLLYYAEIVGRLSTYRKLIDAANRISEIGYKANHDISESINQADGLLLELRKGVSSTEVISPKEKSAIMFERYARMLNKQNSDALSTGLSKFDELLGGGYYPSTLNIIGANTGMGKSTLMQYLANKLSEMGNVVYFSGEMGIEDLGDRDVAGMTGIPINKIRYGNYKDELYKKITDAAGQLEYTNVYTYDKSPITTAKILQACLNIQLRHGLVAVFVDYLGLLDDNIGENRNIVLGNITKRLKQIARQLGIPVIAAHQLSRDTTKRDDKRPVLSDLRESGHIEEDADTVVFIYRDNYFYDEKTWKTSKVLSGQGEYPKNITELIVAKQRQGGSGGSNKAVRVYFDEVSQQYGDLDFRGYDE